MQSSTSSVHSVLSFNPPVSSPSPQSPGPTSELSSAIDATLGRRERRRKEVFERLLIAARHVIMSRGLEHATVKDITDAADVGKGTFFLHFRSKEHVVPALIEREGVIFQRALERARNGESVMTLLEALFSGNPVSGSLDSTVFFRSQLLAVIAKDDVRELSMQSLIAIRDRIQALLTVGQERGEIRRDHSAAELARLTQQVGFGAKLFAMWGQIDASTDYMTSSWRLVIALLQAPSQSPAMSVRQAAAPADRGKVPPVAPRRRSRGV
jgi:AcrR family transcriptional regulator